MQLAIRFTTIILLLFLIGTNRLNAQNYYSLVNSCIDTTSVAVAFTGETEINTCSGDGTSDRIRFATSNLAMAYGYVVVDDSDIIVSIGFSNFIDFEMLPAGQLRVYAFSNHGLITAEVGDTFSTATLAVPCFGLTTNFVLVNNAAPGPPSIATPSGETEFSVCPGDGLPDIVTVTSDPGVNNLVYLVTDEENVILAINEDGMIDFDGAGSGVCRIYSFAYLGDLTVGVGDDLDDLEDFGCGGPSADYITVIRQDVNGGTVSIDDGSTEVQICPGDGNADVINFTSSDVIGSNYVYVVTDTFNNILSVSTADSIDFDDAPVGVCRVWGLAFEGEIVAAIGDNAAEVDLASGCFDLSDNFVTVVREVPVGGTVATSDGDTEVSLCPDDGDADLYTFVVTGAEGGSTTLVVTDDNNVIIAVPEGDEVDFEGAGFGICRVWNLTYQGDIIAQPGDNAAEVALSDGCFELSDNFVTVIRTNPEGGTLATAEGETEVTTCPGDGLDDIITVVNTGATGSNLAYVVTDTNNVILALSETNEINLENAGPGVCRIWTLSYEGEVLAQIGDNAGEVRLATGCSSLSDNFITVDRIEVVGGTVATVDGETEIQTCPGDGVDDIFQFVSEGASDVSFTYVVTDENNVILGLPEGDEVNFETAGEGNCRLWGLAYVGDITATVGDNAAEVDLASGCFALSDNFVTVIREVPLGGTVATTEGDTVVAVCPGDMMPDLISFVTEGASGGTTTYVITDDNNVILGVPEGDSNDFEGADFGICRVWNLTYQGELTAQIGDTASIATLASSCYELSSNFITVIRTNPEGGSLATDAGETEVTTCPGDGLADIIVAVNTGATGTNLAYVVTDAENNILAFPPTNEIDLEGAGVGVCRIWTLAYEGEVLAQIGDNAAMTRLASGCFSLSENFITVNRIEVNGGTVATVDGETELLTCPGDGVDDIFQFASEGASDVNFTYVVTDAENNILAVPDSNEFNFEGAGEGICRLWGLAYLGELTANLGDNAGEVQLASGCFSLSDNFVTVVREVPAAGTITTSDGVTEIVTCQGDGIDDIISFVTEGASGGQVAYVVTDTNNVILAFPDSNAFNFEGAGLGICRVWTVTYQGELTAQVGDNAAEVDLASSCFDLSDDFVAVIRFVPDGGMITTDLGETEVSVCPGDDLPDVVSFVNDDASATNIAYAITDTNNVILALTVADSFDFSGADLGICRVWSLTYDGIILAEVGDNAGEVRLASGCYSLSDNFITVNRIEIEGGTVATTDGETEITTCPGDGNEDIFTFVNTGNSDLNFTFVVTDEENNILGVPGGGTIDFDNAGAGNCRVWGLTYAGSLLASIGDNAAEVQLASGCFALTENFVNVIREAPEGGTVSTEDGETMVMTCPGDGVPDIVMVDSTGSSLSNYTYVITDNNGVIISIPFGDRFNLDGAGTGICRIYGIGFNGIFMGQIGDTVGVNPLSSSCNVASENFITVIRERPAGGTVSTEDGETEVFVCPSDDLADVITFQSEGASGGAFTFVVTDTNNIILSVPSADSVDFNPAGLGTCRLWGLSYQGELLAQVGDNAGEVLLSDGCFALSDNFVTVYREEVTGGSVSTTSGATMVTTCPSDGNDDIINFQTIGASTGNFTYVITDTNNVIIGVPEGNSANFEEAGLGICRVWGLTYVGDLLATLGDTASAVDLASGCYALTDNFVTVIRTEPEGGSISTEMGDGTIDLCSGDDIPDLIQLSATGNSPGNYTFIVAQEGFVLAELPGSEFDFNNAQPGTYTIYGLAYAGNLTFIPGDPVETSSLASSCFDLSDNIVTINIERVDGCELGVVGIEGDFAYLCPQNPEDGVLEFTTCSDRADTNYIYVITTVDDVILTAIEGNVFDFGALPLPQARVYGISYTGTLTSPLTGMTVTSATLSDGCFDITDNFITVVNDQPDAGEISLEEGVFSPFCVANGDGSFSVSTTSESNAGYVILVTDSLNVVQQIADPSNVDFSLLPEGSYRLHGLSYTGNLTVMVGDDADLVALADNCFELTSEFIVLERGQDIAGGVISFSSGVDTFYVCPQDGVPDLVQLQSTIGGVPYRYLVTDNEGNILIPDINSNIINFDNAAPGVCRIYGYAFTGTILATFGANVNEIALSSECYALSENFLTVVREAPEGGTVSTTDGETEVTITIGSDDTEVTVAASGAAELIPYTYVVTDTNNVILMTSDGPTFDFADAGAGVCRIWGLSYQGNLLAQPGDSATIMLTDACFSLSDNFVTVTRATGLQSEEVSLLSLTPFPNPTSGSQLQVMIESDEVLTDGQAYILDQNGRSYAVSVVAGGSNSTVVTFDISDLPTGLFVVRYTSGDRQEVVRFIRQ